MGSGVYGNKPPVEEEQGKTKTCSKCKEEKELTEFYKKKASKDGCRSECKECTKAVNKKWASKNYEKRLASSREWKRRNKQHVSDYNRKYVNSDPEYHRQRLRKWYYENREAAIASATRWAKSNAEKKKEYDNRRRARKANAEGSFTAHDWKQKLEYYGYRCRYCNIHKEDTPEGWLEADHAIPLSRGGTNWISNIVPACKSCNCSKGTKTFKEFMGYINGN
jgi:predicted restriction endonuclease